MKFVKFSLQPLHTLKKDVAPLLFLGARMILTSVYTTFNTIYLGLFCGDVQVGYYTTAIKLQNIILALYSSFTLVMMPRVSALMAERDETGVKRMLQQSFDLLFAFVFPCILFVEFYAEELVYLVAGEGFEGSVLPMRVVMPLMPIIGLEQILIIQILIPHRADKKVFVSTVVGALCSMVLNVLIVEKLQSVGSAIVWFMSELIVMLMALYFVDQRYRDLLSVQESVKYIVIFSPLSLLLFLVSVSFPSVWLCFGIGVLLTLIYSHIVLHYLIKNETYIKCVEMLQKRIDRSHILAR